MATRGNLGRGIASLAGLETGNPGPRGSTSTPFTGNRTLGDWRTMDQTGFRDSVLGDDVSEEGREAMRRVEEDRKAVRERIRELEEELDRLEVSQALDRSRREDRVKTDDSAKDEHKKQTTVGSQTPGGRKRPASLWTGMQIRGDREGVSRL